MLLTAGLGHDALDPNAARSYVRVQAEAALADAEAMGLPEAQQIQDLLARKS